MTRLSPLGLGALALSILVVGVAVASAARLPEAPACAVFPASSPWNQRVDRLPVAPNSAQGLARYEDVAKGRIDHALRFTVNRTRRAYVWRATSRATRPIRTCRRWGCASA